MKKSEIFTSLREVVRHIENDLVTEKSVIALIDYIVENKDEIKSGGLDAEDLNGYGGYDGSLDLIEKLLELIK